MELQKSDVIWFNGELVPWDEAKVHVLAHVLHYGSGVFEGIRAYATPNGPAVVELAQHVERLFRSCKAIELPIPFEPEVIEAAIRDTIRRNGHDACYIRPLVFRGYGQMGIDPRRSPVEVIVATWGHGSHFGAESIERGIRMGVSSWRRMAPDTHPAMAKAVGNYLNSQMIMLEAKRHGYDDGIALDIGGCVCEGSGANVFVVFEGVIRTPPLFDSVLPGITRSCVIRLARDLGMDLVEERIPREMLYMAEEVFITGTAAEVTPVREIDGRPVGEGSRGPITERLQREFFAIVRGEAKDRFGWLTPVG